MSSNSQSQIPVFLSGCDHDSVMVNYDSRRSVWLLLSATLLQQQCTGIKTTKLRMPRFSY